jgi:hypothetical protein
VRSANRYDDRASPFYTLDRIAFWQKAHGEPVVTAAARTRSPARRGERGLNE